MNSKRRFLQTMGAGMLAPAAALAATSRAAGPRAAYFPNAVLQTHEGKKVRFYDDLLRGKTVVINMTYTVCTNICPPMTANLLAVQELLGERVGRDIYMYSLTLRPEFDTPEALRAYANQYRVGPGWTFLTGKPGDLDTIRRKLGFYDLNPEVDKDLTQHTGMLRIGNEALDRWCMMPALSSPRQIAEAILNL